MRSANRVLVMAQECCKLRGVPALISNEIASFVSNDISNIDASHKRTLLYIHLSCLSPVSGEEILEDLCPVFTVNAIKQFSGLFINQPVDKSFFRSPEYLVFLTGHLGQVMERQLCSRCLS